MEAVEAAEVRAFILQLLGLPNRSYSLQADTEEVAVAAEEGEAIGEVEVAGKQAMTDGPVRTVLSTLLPSYLYLLLRLWVWP
jgi:hypothetical protein